jgi:hypothetical protein
MRPSGFGQPTTRDIVIGVTIVALLILAVVLYIWLAPGNDSKDKSTSVPGAKRSAMTCGCAVETMGLEPTTPCLQTAMGRLRHRAVFA